MYLQMRKDTGIYKGTKLRKYLGYALQQMHI